MGEALSADAPNVGMPEGIVRLRIDRASGRRVTGTPENSMLEYFLEEFQPNESTDSQQSLGTDELEGLF